jgi:hypothetical protein
MVLLGKNLGLEDHLLDQAAAYARLAEYLARTEMLGYEVL